MRRRQQNRDAIDRDAARDALAELPEATSHGDDISPLDVYLPRSHLKAMNPDNQLVIGMRGAGKTFWWQALQETAVRRLIDQSSDRSLLSQDTRVQTGFGVKSALDQYPGKDVLRALMNGDFEPRTIWRTVLAWNLAEAEHPLRKKDSWPARVRYVDDNPEPVERLLQVRDEELDADGVYSLSLFDALDRCADDWRNMRRAIRGLLQTALEMRSYRRLRMKVFLRSDQVEESSVADFPDASKILSSAVELNWPRQELYGLLWHLLVNRSDASDLFRRQLGSSDLQQLDIGTSSNLHVLPRALVTNEDEQRNRFHELAGPWMGRDRRRGFPYTWIPNHLGDAEGRVSPRSFIEALRKAAADTADRYPDHGYALHYDSIKRGVQEASTIRVTEIKEDYPWVDRALTPLGGLVVPCRFREISKRWKDQEVVRHLTEGVNDEEVRLPPINIADGADGIRRDLEDLGVLVRMTDGRVNIPDVFRVGYGLGRKGGVRPVR